MCHIFRLPNTSPSDFPKKCNCALKNSDCTQANYFNPKSNNFSDDFHVWEILFRKKKLKRNFLCFLSNASGQTFLQKDTAGRSSEIPPQFSEVLIATIDQTLGKNYFADMG